MVGVVQRVQPPGVDRRGPGVASTVGVPVWIHQADAVVAKGAKATKNDGKARSYLLRVEFLPDPLVSLARRGATRLIPIQEVSTFADGETLAVPGRPRAVHARGTPRGVRHCCWRGGGCC